MPESVLTLRPWVQIPEISVSFFLPALTLQSFRTLGSKVTAALFFAGVTASVPELGRGRLVFYSDDNADIFLGRATVIKRISVSARKLKIII